MPGYWFISDLFEIAPHEDDETNPGLYGKELASWIRQRFAELGYGVEEVIAEDWGWLVLCSREPFLLGVSCVGQRDQGLVASGSPKGPAEDMVWNCMAFVEVPFFSRLFRRVDTRPGVRKIERELQSILHREPRIQLVPEP